MSKIVVVALVLAGSLVGGAAVLAILGKPLWAAAVAFSGIGAAMLSMVLQATENMFDSQARRFDSIQKHIDNMLDAIRKLSP